MTTKEVDDNTSASTDGEEADRPIPVAVAVAIPDSDEEAQAVAEASREEATTNIREHCERHLSLNPESSYVGWIATRKCNYLWHVSHCGEASLTMPFY